MTSQKIIGGLVVRRPAVLDKPVLALLRALNVAVISTHGADRVIHSRTVWVDTDGQHILLNSVAGRVWVDDLERDANVTCTVVNVNNPYEFASIEGCLVERSAAGAEEHIDFLARKYLGVEAYPFRSATEPRLLFKIRPERILHMSPEDPGLAVS